MDSPRTGFRRGAVASWTLAGIGIAGVAGASALAYADTVKPAAIETTVTVLDPPMQEPPPILAVDGPPVPEVVATTTDAPPPPPPPAETTVDQAPVTQWTPAPQYTAPAIAEPPQAPATHRTAAPTATAPSSTTRRNLTPTTVKSPNYSPHVTISRGS